MSEFLDNLGKDVFPAVMIDHFVRWCVWEEARPALVKVLSVTGVDELSNQIKHTSSYSDLETLSERAGKYAHEIGKRTGPLGISTAEAISFLAQKLAHAAQESDWDPEAVSFFTIQVLGWHGFAESMFTDIHKKVEAADAARERQENKLAELWEKFGATSDK